MEGFPSHSRMTLGGRLSHEGYEHARRTDYSAVSGYADIREVCDAVKADLSYGVATPAERDIEYLVVPVTAAEFYEAMGEEIDMPLGITLWVVHLQWNGKCKSSTWIRVGGRGQSFAKCHIADWTLGHLQMEQMFDPKCPLHPNRLIHPMSPDIAETEVPEREVAIWKCPDTEEVVCEIGQVASMHRDQA